MGQTAEQTVRQAAGQTVGRTAGQTAGRVHSFQSMGAVDGPGLRCVVFLQGCPLRCVYCHNPDTWEFGAGQSVTPQEMVKKILRFRPYLKRGGVTVTGGEPLSQPEFVRELFALLRENGIHTALDTSGAGGRKRARAVLEVTDLVLADVKFLTDEEYRRYCGADFSQIREFLSLTREMEKPLWIRQVIVPGLNDDPRRMKRLADLLREYPNVERIELLPFRRLCLEKYEALGIPFALADTPEMDGERLAALAEELRTHTAAAVCC